MTTPYTEPKLDKQAFNCPFCHAFSNFHWSDINVNVRGGSNTINYKAAQCAHCKEWTIWTNETKRIGQGGLIKVGSLIYPFKLTSPLPSSDLPETCKKEYEEARMVFPFSPRASAALLRLCVQKLCKELGEDGENINKDIAELVKKGLDKRIQKALDIVRVSGNNSVHPGVMNIDDDEELVNKLFSLVNMIVDEMITKPKELEELYGKLPEVTVEAIEKRDNQE